jgi:5'-3' exonuclease
MDSKKLVLVDGHSILNRAFYGMPDLTNAAGVHTGAVFGFLNILFKILDEEKADYLTVAFDVHAPTFRHEIYKEYEQAQEAYNNLVSNLIGEVVRQANGDQEGQCTHDCSTCGGCH